MQCVLNFSGEDKQPILLFLKRFPEMKTKSIFELLRCKIGKSTVTMYASGKLVLQGSDCHAVKEKVLKALDIGNEVILGIDEVGRGEATGPFVVAAVLAKPSRLRELRDSKKVKNIEEKRSIVEQKALAISVFSISSQHLSRLHEKGINLNQIEVRAINAWHDFFAGLGKRVLVDGNPLKGCKKGVQFLAGGDDINPVIGAASVVAKSVREKSKDKGKRAGWGSWQRKK